MRERLGSPLRLFWRKIYKFEKPIFYGGIIRRKPHESSRQWNFAHELKNSQ
jgi:hypothetical protein